MCFVSIHLRIANTDCGQLVAYRVTDLFNANLWVSGGGEPIISRRIQLYAAEIIVVAIVIAVNGTYQLTVATSTLA
ncbi:MAG: hypothetical protein KDA92_05420 [Planctomycetales bacterium]|nr:hypothetical protein [Planctomycetales bacterium]